MQNSYALFLGVGAALGLWRVAQAADPDQALRRVDGALWTLVGALAGARLGVGFSHSAYFQTHPAEMLLLPAGGLSVPGALLAGLGAGLWTARRSGWALRPWLDDLARLTFPLAAAALLGAWLHGVGAGAAAGWGLPAPDELGVTARRVPAQLLAALLLGLVTAAGERWVRPGARAAWTALALGLSLLLAEGLRAQPDWSWLDLTLNSWTAVVLILAGGLGTLVLARRKWNPSEWEGGPQT